MARALFSVTACAKRQRGTMGLLATALLFTLTVVQGRSPYNPYYYYYNHYSKVVKSPAASPGLAVMTFGMGYFLPYIDVADLQAIDGTGETILQLPLSCIVESKVTQQVSELKRFDSTSEFASSLGIDTSVSLGASVLGFTASASISHAFSSSSSVQSSYSSSILREGTSLASFSILSDCYDQAHLSPSFLKDFAALPVSIASTSFGATKQALSVTNSDDWGKFDIFLKKYGSHIVTSATAGALIEILATQNSDEQITSEDTTTALCLGAGGYGVQASACNTWKSGSSSSAKTSSVSVNARTYGGDVTLGSQLVTSATRKDATDMSDLLSKFLATASTGTFSKFFYTATWDILQTIFNRYDDPENFIRASLLQQYFQKVLADYRYQTVPECWFPHMHWNDYEMNSVADIASEEECKDECQRYSTCEAWEYRQNDQKCWLHSAVGTLQVKSKSVAGYADDCGVKSSSLLGGYELLLHDADSTDIAVDVVSCTYPIASKTDCQKCGNIWVTETLKDYECGCVFWSCGCNTYDLAYCCSTDDDVTYPADVTAPSNSCIQVS